MAPSPIIQATVQSTILAATSNLISQALGAYNGDKPLVIDWVQLFQFTIFAIISTPPNFMWQDYLESTFPAVDVAPTKEAIASAGANDEKALDQEAKEGRLVEPKLNVKNTATKLVLDQTVGAAVNTFMFSVFIHSIRTAMAHRPSSPEETLAFLISGPTKALDYSAVRWDAVLAASRAEFWQYLFASWKLWPLVSFVNFALVKDVQTRNLIGGLAGVGWGIYVSSVAAAS